MKVLISRISQGKVSVGGKSIASVGRGLAVFAGIEKDDGPSELVWAARKITTMRVFENDEGKMHFSVKDKEYEILCVSNFTLCADTDRGRRPSFDVSMTPDMAMKMFEDFLMLFRESGIKVESGAFGEHMDIELVMDGPVNIMIDSKKDSRRSK